MPEIVNIVDGGVTRPRRARARFLVRHILPSDNHTFVGRIYDLSIIAYHFDSYEELAQHPDCKYAIDVNSSLSALTRRVESLNLVGSMLWPKSMPTNFKGFPVSRYDWLMISADVFLMRYISVIDCTLLLINSVYEAGLGARKCSIENLAKKGVPIAVTALLNGVLKNQGELRDERNSRFHHGAERGFTQDDQTFQTAALFEHRMNGVTGIDQFGRKIDIERSFREGLVELQREFNRVTRQLVRDLDKIYGCLAPEFESRFGPLIRSSTHGLRVSKRG